MFLCEESKFIKITVKNTALTIISNPVAPDFEELCLGCFFRYRKHNFLKEKLVKIAQEFYFFRETENPFRAVEQGLVVN